ncbi:MAG: rRNA processing protein RimM [Clostridia bacterium]|nr:rRNA processing protein RimM [Clostridia bacterium]
MSQKKIIIGKVINTHGLRGEVKVLPLTDFPERFRSDLKLYLEQGEKIHTVTVNRVRTQGRHLIIKFSEINDANEAEKLRGALLKVEPWEVEPLPPGHYYIFQLVGASVFTTDGDFLGTLREVIATGANDVFVVKNDENKEILIPALKDVVKNIDLDKGKIEIKIIPGLLD